MNLSLSLVLPFLVFQVIMGIDPTSRTSNKLKSRSIRPSKEVLERNAGDTGLTPPPDLSPPCC
ncbi:hypothetical protein PSTT_07623 [Puccinia striiformis]|uniref:Uncharacterized protein n=1 Tax=Puccinia striiformis TaxID=27350 RepID=A0A2S4VFQ5_9BASI|nr:hypothetical protein PSTT_07623 [Puccinia striiformis]